MAYPDNLLVQGERVIVRKRPHWKVLILPTVFFIVIIGGGVALATWINSRDWSNEAIIDYVIIGVAVVALIILVLVPFIRWRTEHFVITNHHVFFRSGLLSPAGAPDPARADREHGNRGHLLGSADGLRIADRRIVRGPAAEVPQRRVAVQGAGPAEPADPGRARGHPPTRRSRPPGGFPAQGAPDYPPQGYPQQDYSAAPQQGYPAQGSRAIRHRATRSRAIRSRVTRRAAAPRATSLPQALPAAARVPTGRLLAAAGRADPRSCPAARPAQPLRLRRLRRRVRVVPRHSLDRTRSRTGPDSRFGDGAGRS